MKKPSFFERLTGAIPVDDFDKSFDDDSEFDNYDHHDDLDLSDNWQGVEEEVVDDAPEEGELPVDMYQTNDAIIIRALVAGVNPNDIEINITRDMVTISGQREEFQEASDDNYYHRELFWGGFTRTLLLPEEVIIDEASAEEKHGFLEIRLPKLDKNRSTQLEVKPHTAKK